MLVIIEHNEEMNIFPPLPFNEQKKRPSSVRMIVGLFLAVTLFPVLLLYRMNCHPTPRTAVG